MGYKIALFCMVEAQTSVVKYNRCLTHLVPALPDGQSADTGQCDEDEDVDDPEEVFPHS